MSNIAVIEEVVYSLGPIFESVAVDKSRAQAPYLTFYLIILPANQSK